VRAAALLPTQRAGGWVKPQMKSGRDGAARQLAKLPHRAVRGPVCEGQVMITVSFVHPKMTFTAPEVAARASEQAVP